MGDSNVSGQPDLNKEMYYSLLLVVFEIAGLVISPLGIIFNIVTIIVFVKLGFKDKMNITLVILAVADTTILLTLIGYSTVLSPPVLRDVTHMDIIDALSYLFGWLNVLTTRVAGCLTAFITLERFVCVAIPFKVKKIFTKKNTILFAVSVYVVLIAYSTPMFVANNIGPRFNALYNETVVGLVTSADSSVLESISRGMNVTTEVISFLLVTFFTLGLIHSFFRSTKWRISALSGREGGSMSNRDRKLVKMVLFISLVFIGCCLPSVSADIVMLFVKEFTINGKEKFLFLVADAIFFDLSAINSTVNIFIYLKMSSKFSRAFFELFSCFGSRPASTRGGNTKSSRAQPEVSSQYI